MARAGASKLARVACRSLQTSRVTRTSFPSVAAAPTVVQSAPIFPNLLTPRRFISNSSDRKAITPDAKAPKAAETPEVLKTPADITEGDYHTVADEYLDKLLSRLEQLQDEREDVDVEYSVRHPPLLPPFASTRTPHANIPAGRRPHPRSRSRPWHICHQQAAAQ